MISRISYQGRSRLGYCEKFESTERVLLKPHLSSCGGGSFLYKTLLLFRESNPYYALGEFLRFNWPLTSDEFLFSGSFRDKGSSMIKEDPWPVWLSTEIFPLCSWTIWLEMESPNPVPLFFVVKKGLKISSRWSRGIPWPVSVNVIRMYVFPPGLTSEYVSFRGPNLRR